MHTSSKCLFSTCAFFEFNISHFTMPCPKILHVAPPSLIKIEIAEMLPSRLLHFILNVKSIENFINFCETSAYKTLPEFLCKIFI